MTTIVGWRRVANAGACIYCQTLEGAFVKSADAMPMHPGCGCTLEPVLGKARKRRDEPVVPRVAGVDEAQRAVSAVVRVGELAVEALDESDSATARFIADRRAVAVHPDNGVPTNANAVTHEYGHYVDRLLGGGDEYLTETTAGDAIYQTLKNTGTMKAVREDAFEILKGDTVTRNYFLQGKEMFARAFHQYVATKTRDPHLLAELEHVRGDRFLSFQFWPDDEFAPIERAFDELFRERGIAV